MEKEEKFVGLVGLGYWGKNILRNLYGMGVLHTACDLDLAACREREKSFPGIQYLNDCGCLFQDEGIKAVAIAAPAAAHYGLVKKALLRGKDVFVEKPLASRVEEGEELVRLAEKRGRILMVGHILHYHPAMRALKKLIREGRLGELRYIYSNRLNMGKLRSEEDILWSFAPHDISLILDLMGEEPLRVSAFGGDYVTRGIADITVTALEFANGKKGHIFVSWLNPFKEQKLTVIGSRAMAVFDDVSEEKLFVYPYKIEWKENNIPEAGKAGCEVVPFEGAEPLREELEHFLFCVRTRTRPQTDGHEGLRVLKVLAEAHESLLREKKRGPQKKAETKYFAPKYFAHETAFIDEGAEIGEGTKIWHYSHILPGAKIGANCVIGQNVMIGPDVVVGNKCKIQNNVSLYKGVVLEDEVFCAPSCVFTNVYNPRAFIERKNEFRKTLVKRGATIGANATIVCGATIGEYAFIAAGAVVAGNVPPYALMAGVPARRIDFVCRCGTSLKREGSSNGMSVCSGCGNRYSFEAGGEEIKVLLEERA